MLIVIPVFGGFFIRKKKGGGTLLCTWKAIWFWILDKHFKDEYKWQTRAKHTVYAIYMYFHEFELGWEICDGLILWFL